MEVFKKELYYNAIYEAVVVNDDTSQDPDKQGRVQIYIPSVHYRYEAIYKSYMKDSNKSNNPDKSKFPWALPLTESPKNGNVVYCGNINNNVSQYLIFGLDANNPANQGAGGTNASGGLIGTDILNLAMPVIIMEETGIGKSSLPALTFWPDGIPDSYFSTIENVTGKPRGLGLIQWTASRAYDLLYDIASASSNWESAWPDKTIDLYKQLKKSISTNSSSGERNSNAMTQPMTAGSTVYNSVKNMLLLAESKTVQLQKCQDDTRVAIDKLQADPYNLTNPALIIYLADIMNQYGNGVNNVITGCLSQAATINKSSKSMIEQLNEFVSFWKGRVKQYLDRRDRVYSYIAWLESQGKLYAGTLVDLGELASSPFIPEIGEYLWPMTKSTQINCYWGVNTLPVTYNFKYNKAMGNVMGYPSGGWHSGVDFGPAQRGVDGDPLIAVGNGTVAYVSGNTGGQGNCIAIQMNKNPQHFFVYMHLCRKPELNVGQSVTAGQVVGYMGSTGNSTGTHLHLGLHIGGVWPSGGSNNRNVRIDCLPYLGKKANT